jgi:hypothetical protein
LPDVDGRDLGEGEPVRTGLTRPMSVIGAELLKYPVATWLALSGSMIVACLDSASPTSQCRR